MSHSTITPNEAQRTLKVVERRMNYGRQTTPKGIAVDLAIDNQAHAKSLRDKVAQIHQQVTQVYQELGRITDNDRRIAGVLEYSGDADRRARKAA